MQSDAVQRLQRASQIQGKTTDNVLVVQKAENASVMVSMFEVAGQREKALDIERDTPSMFKEDWKFLLEGEFSLSEIKSFGPKELKLVASALIGSSKHWSHFATTLTTNVVKLCVVMCWKI